jgi:hypothetical protein
MESMDDNHVFHVDFGRDVDHTHDDRDEVHELEEIWAPLDRMIIEHYRRRGDELSQYRLYRIEDS